MAANILLSHTQFITSISLTFNLCKPMCRLCRHQKAGSYIVLFLSCSYWSSSVLPSNDSLKEVSCIQSNGFCIAKNSKPVFEIFFKVNKFELKSVAIAFPAFFRSFVLLLFIFLSETKI